MTNLFSNNFRFTEITKKIHWVLNSDFAVELSTLTTRFTSPQNGDATF